MQKVATQRRRGANGQFLPDREVVEELTSVRLASERLRRGGYPAAVETSIDEPPSLGPEHDAPAEPRRARRRPRTDRVSVPDDEPPASARATAAAVLRETAAVREAGRRIAARRGPVETVDVVLALPVDLVEALRPIVESRGLRLEQVAQLYLRSLVTGHRRGAALRLEDEMPFGKFRGEAVELVIRTEPRYVSWMLENVDSFSLDLDALALLGEVTGA